MISKDDPVTKIHGPEQQKQKYNNNNNNKKRREKRIQIRQIIACKLKQKQHKQTNSGGVTH